MFKNLNSTDIWNLADVCFISAASAVFTFVVVTQIVSPDAALAVSFALHPFTLSLIYFKANLFDATKSIE